MSSNATQKLGRYSVFGTLAKGSFSRVRYATAGDTGESFALKIIDRTKIEQEGLLERLKNEITIMRMLQHKCVVTVADMLASNNRIFLVVDLMMGGNLRTKILREGYLNETESRFYFHQLFCGRLRTCRLMPTQSCLRRLCRTSPTLSF